MIDLKATGDEIKRRIFEAGYTISEFAKIMYVTQNAVYLWLRGIQLPTVDKLLTMSNIFGCKIDDLIVRCK